MYQVKRKDGSTFFTTTNPKPTVFEKIKLFFLDKWWWLLSFSKPPKIIINQDIVGYEGEPHVIEIEGRITLTINGSLILKKKKQIHDDKAGILKVQAN